MTLTTRDLVRGTMGVCSSADSPSWWSLLPELRYSLSSVLCLELRGVVPLDELWDLRLMLLLLVSLRKELTGVVANPAGDWCAKAAGEAVVGVLNAALDD